MTLSFLLLFSLVLVHGDKIQQATVKPSVSDQNGECHSHEVEYRYRGDLLCHSLTPKLPFANALQECRKIDGRITTIYNKEHNDLLYCMLTESAFIGAVSRQRMDRHPRWDLPGVIWSWLSAHPPLFTNVLRNETRGFPRQPDGGGFEGCMEMMKHPVLKNDPGNGYWGDTDCRAAKPALCTRTVRTNRPMYLYDRGDWKYGILQGPRAACADGFSRVGVERLGEDGDRSTCLSGPQEARNMSAALLRCQELDSSATVARPARLAGRRRWLHAPSAGNGSLVWAGAERRNARLQWRWQADGRAVPRAAWAAYEPRDEIGADCAAYDAERRGMVATDCNTPLEFVCESQARGCPTGFRVTATGLRCVREDQSNCQGTEEYTGDAPVAAPCEARLCPLICPQGFTQLEAKCVEVYDDSNYYAEQTRYCLGKRTRNIMVNSQEENEFVRRQAVRLRRPLWVSKEDINFTRWHQYVPYGLPDEPNEVRAEFSNSTSCAVMWYDGEWMDVDCFLEFPSVCERLIRWLDCARAVSGQNANRWE